MTRTSMYFFLHTFFWTHFLLTSLLEYLQFSSYFLYLVLFTYIFFHYPYSFFPLLCPCMYWSMILRKQCFLNKIIQTSYYHILISKFTLFQIKIFLFTKKYIPSIQQHALQNKISFLKKNPWSTFLRRNFLWIEWITTLFCIHHTYPT